MPSHIGTTNSGSLSNVTEQYLKEMELRVEQYKELYEQACQVRKNTYAFACMFICLVIIYKAPYPIQKLLCVITLIEINIAWGHPFSTYAKITLSPPPLLPFVRILYGGSGTFNMERTHWLTPLLLPRVCIKPMTSIKQVSKCEVMCI